MMKTKNFSIATSVLILFFLICSSTGCSGVFSSILSRAADLSKAKNQQKVPDGSLESGAAYTSDENSSEEKETYETAPPMLKIYVDPAIPASSANRLAGCLQKSFDDYMKGNIPDNAADNVTGSGNDGGTAAGAIAGFDYVNEKNGADLIFEFVSAKENGSLKGPLYFAPVVSFYSLIEEIPWDDLKSFWEGSRDTVRDIEGNEIPANLVLSSQTLEVLSLILGECRVKNLTIKENSEIKAAVTEDVDVLSIIPFDQIEKEYKVLSIDGKSVLDKNTTYGQYPLACGIKVKAATDFVDADFKKILDANLDSGGLSNRSENDMVSILITGVTALTRQVADRMDRNGLLYPAEKIRETLLDADITHISNEVSFVEDCYAARPNTMVFCSKPEYIQLLKYIDTDVLELTGNHLNDYGSQWFDYTLDIYDKEGIEYFGGGKNLEDSQKPATFDIGGYKFAFLGANTFGPSSDWATADRSGSAPINTLDAAQQEKDIQKYEEEIKMLKSEGYNVIFTFQYLETYDYSPTNQQIKDFERMSDAGAVIVNGSQAHQPQGFEIRENGFINFGLGNLFFGQAAGLPVKQGMLAKHIFYKGKHINTVMKTIYIEDLSQPRLTEGQERADLLKAVFKGSVIDVAISDAKKDTAKDTLENTTENGMENTQAIKN
jgi:poly-gamma-glutamate capsule biosynthesis protein CapA/YwtB (metallophosphatase superfamily)